MFSDLAYRIAAVAPRRFCDDQENWRKEELRIRAARNRLARERELQNLGLSYEIIDDFFSETFVNLTSAADYLPVKHSRIVNCDACKNPIEEYAIYSGKQKRNKSLR